jgi:protein ImuB
VWLKRLATDRLVRNRAASPRAHSDSECAPDSCVGAYPLRKTDVHFSGICANEPLVVVAPIKSALRLVAVNAEAERLGLKAGMALADARAMYPKLACADADSDADQLLLTAVADWCDRYTPLVGIDAPDTLILDITGCAHLFGGEAALRHDLTRRLAAQGFEVCSAVADTVGCAWGLSHFGANGALVAPGAAREALKSLPLAALRLASESVDALARVGLKRISDVLDRPRAPLAARFGETLIRRIDQALGDEDEPISPLLPVPPYVVERRFAEPIALERDMLGTIEQLAGELQRLLERRGEGARLLQVALFRADGKVHRIAVGTSAPLRDQTRLRRLFEEKLAAVGDECDPGFGFDVIRLSALVAERCDPQQTGLVMADLASPDHEAEFAHLIDRLGARFGLRRVVRLVPQDVHIPEFAVAAVPAHAVGRSRSVGCTVQVVEQDSLGSVRPIRLFAHPEPIEAVAEVPDGPPVRFKWRRVMHDVAHAEGPERIAMEWWRDQKGRKLTRDYFRIESRDGVRVWVYREGLYGRETTQPRWFLHGLFA